MRWITFSLALVFTFAFTGKLNAQNTIKVPHQEFSADRSSPATGSEDYLTVEGGNVSSKFAPHAAFLLDYAHRPFVLDSANCKDSEGTNCSLGKTKRELVSYQLAMDFMGSLTFLNRFEVGLLLPLVITEGDSFDTPLLPNYHLEGGTAFAVGDMRLNGKVGILGKGSTGFFLAGSAFVTAPTGHASAPNRFVGHDGFTGGAGVIAEYRTKMVRFAANLGGTFRPTRTLFSTKTGSEMAWGLGTRIAATSLLSVLGEVIGSTAFTAKLDENPLEVRLAAQLRQGDFVIMAGGGVGLVSGVGVPNFRVLAGVGWQPYGADADGDGIRDDVDACPTEPEDFDGYNDSDGCPDEDNDGDGIPDIVDKCPNEAEDKDGFQDDDGCPDLDNDKDGILDGYDSCPNEPEDKDGDRDDDGCPDYDTDRDGIDDAHDKCPNEPEDFDGVADDDGCPEVDADGDGIPDTQDECPEQPEDFNGYQDEDGCPDADQVPGSSTGNAPAAAPEAPAKQGEKKK
jgi:OmpA-OmpF porin, OOP family